MALLDVARPDIDQLTEQRHAVLIGVVEVQPERAAIPGSAASRISVIDNDVAPSSEISRASMGTSWLRRAAMSPNRRY